MSPAEQCLTCGRPLPGDAPRKLCPACMFEAALERDSGPISLGGDQSPEESDTLPPDEPAVTPVSFLEGNEPVQADRPDSTDPYPDWEPSSGGKTLTNPPEFDILTSRPEGAGVPLIPGYEVRE